jgi:hypothetical protein
MVESSVRDTEQSLECALTFRLEDQAFDRAHRLGQKLDVNIFKLTVAGTVEDRRSHLV